MSTPSTTPPAGPRRQTQIGKVTSVAGKQSIVVQVDRRIRHPKYHKFLSRRSKFMAHDERNECTVGDIVEIVASRPLSKHKHWRVRSIIDKSVRQGGEAEA